MVVRICSFDRTVFHHLHQPVFFFFPDIRLTSSDTHRCPTVSESLFAKHSFRNESIWVHFLSILIILAPSCLPSGLQFEPGQDYYLTSTSTGFPDGLQNLDGGVCRTRGMKLIFRVCCHDNENDLNEQPRIVQLSEDYEEYGVGGVFGEGMGGGGEGGGGVVGGGDIAGIGSEIDASAEESRSMLVGESRWPHRITSPVPIPPGKVFPSPKILRVITTQREEEGKSVAAPRKWSVLSTWTSLVLAVTLILTFRSR